MKARANNSVRIIGGEYRSRVLRFPDLPVLRPTPDRVRETLFNWLGQRLDGPCDFGSPVAEVRAQTEVDNHGAGSLLERSRPGVVRTSLACSKPLPLRV